MRLGPMFLCSAAIVWVAGCATESLKSLPGKPDELVTVSRTGRVFENGVLCKPDASPDGSLGARLAPLLLKEISSAADPKKESDLTVVVTESEIALPQGRFIQITYLWPRAPSSGRPSPAAPQGFRMTLNSAGAAVIWECLPEADGARVIFIARALEEDARRSHGAPVPGRRYAIEAPATYGPGTVVAGILDDGPVPMGPVVYLEAETGVITTVLCRCSAAQVQNVSATTEYKLRPTPSLPVGELSAASVLTQIQTQWLLSPAHGLTNALRLPDNF